MVNKQQKSTRHQPQTTLPQQSPATVSALDRGLHYGDGVFETLAVTAGQVQLWQPHFVRLSEGCRRLGLPVPEESALHDKARALCHETPAAVLKIILTRGVGGRGYRPPEPATPTELLLLYPKPEYPSAYAESGITLRVCNTRLGRNPALAGIKHLNRLEQVLARREWADPEIAEGLMLDADGWVIEGTMSNLFLIRDDTLLTPDLSQCGVCGIMRGVILELARTWEVQTEIKCITLTDVYAAKAAFICNSVFGIWPVNRIVTDNDWHSYEGDRLTSRIQHYVKNLC